MPIWGPDPTPIDIRALAVSFVTDRAAWLHFLIGLRPHALTTEAINVMEVVNDARSFPPVQSTTRY